MDRWMPLPGWWNLELDDILKAWAKRSDGETTGNSYGFRKGHSHRVRPPLRNCRLPANSGGVGTYYSLVEMQRAQVREFNWALPDLPYTIRQA